ncbi:MAG: hypothetical protein AAGA30_05430, partial [Planctomycetota bacterium]
AKSTTTESNFRQELSQLAKDVASLTEVTSKQDLILSKIAKKIGIENQGVDEIDEEESRSPGDKKESDSVGPDADAEPTSAEEEN